MKNLRIKTLALVLATFGLGVNAQTTFEEISADLNKAGGVYLAYPKVEAKLTPLLWLSESDIYLPVETFFTR